MGCGKKRAAFAYAGDLRHKAQSLVALSERPFVQRGDGCPYCANRKVLPGFNDLATAAPLVAKQWHETLNGALTPEMVTAESQKGVVAVLLRPCLESHHLLARGRAAVRLSRLRRKNESREDIKISACRKADFI